MKDELSTAKGILIASILSIMFWLGLIIGIVAREIWNWIR